MENRVNTNTNIYEDIATRTGGNVIMGVVGPVRTGKSTFIKRFMEQLVIPNIPDEYERERTRDELPQSARGKTVMTTEPKFIPDQAVTVVLDEENGATMQVKMVDCVGFMVPQALGAEENGETRLVHTPWSEQPVPFETAAETGTQKVIREHATIGVLVTTDGTIGEIDRNSYIAAEERTVSELQACKKPFVIILNSQTPEDVNSIALAMELEEKYGAPVALVNCLDLDIYDIRKILEMVLLEFPVGEIRLEYPTWLSALPPEHPMKQEMLKRILEAANSIRRIGEIKTKFLEQICGDQITDAQLLGIALGQGSARVRLTLPANAFYDTLSEQTGFAVSNEKELFTLLQQLAVMKSKFERVAQALDDVNEKGYGIVMPQISDLQLEEPQIVKQNGGWGVKLKASASSIHMIRANIEAEVSPTVGTEEQSEEMVNYLMREFEEDRLKIWETNIFGKSLHALINEGLHNKLEHMPLDARQKLVETIERIINEGSQGLICILL